MVFTVPMTAMTLTTLGVPTVMVAPLATVIPGFMFAAFHSEADDSSGGNSHSGPGRLSRLAQAASQLRTRLDLMQAMTNSTIAADMLSHAVSSERRPSGILGRVFNFLGL